MASSIVNLHHAVAIPLRIKDKDDYMLFRFYDPRVFMDVIPDFNSEQLSAFFGPIQFYLLENLETQKIMRCQVLKGQFHIQPEREDGYLRVSREPSEGVMTALHQSSNTLVKG